MKKATSIKTRITIWYTSLMLVIITIVLTVAGMLSYQLLMDNMEKDIKFQVSKIAEEIGPRPSPNIFYTLESDREFKNVSIYLENGEHIVGEYSFDLSNMEFKDGILRKETVDDETYIVYDVFKPSRPGTGRGIWIRGAESVNFTKMLGHSIFIIVLIIVPFILLLTVLGGYYITRKAFMPINNIVKTADKIYTLNDIEQRIDIPSNAKKDELHNLSVTLNRMLDKIEGLIKQEKQFTSDASHELRTPISVILAQGEYLFEIADSEKEKELAQTIVEKAKQVSKLVSSLLLLARIDAKRQKITKEKVDLGVLIDISVDAVRKKADEKGIIIISNSQDNLIVDADESLLYSVITNLVNNAVKYGRNGGYVAINAERIEESTEITIKDNGIGIEKENLDKIWDRFYRVDNVRNDENGSSGLGLSMVKSIVELHGGKIFVNSEYGEGTEFRIILS